MLKSKRGISPILATLLLIAIAVGAILITYAWVITFTGTQTQQAGAILGLENIRFYNTSSTYYTDITLRNSGTSSAKVVAVYWSDSSFSALQKLTNEYSMTPSTGVVDALDSITITITWGTGIISGNWTSGNTYYFKVATEAGTPFQFTGKAP
jgi:flagellin-like protein